MNISIDPRAAAVIALLLSLTMPSLAQAPRVERAEVIAAGFFAGRLTGKTTSAAGTVAGMVKDIQDVEFLAEPPAKSAAVGTRFGVRFRLVGQPRHGNATLRAVWKIPTPGIMNPDNGNIYRQSTSEFTVRIGDEVTRGYIFDEPWEVVLGGWILQIWQGDRKLIEKSFAIR